MHKPNLLIALACTAYFTTQIIQMAIALAIALLAINGLLKADIAYVMPKEGESIILLALCAGYLSYCFTWLRRHNKKTTKAQPPATQLCHQNF
ncbi:MAG: hypothetical protein CMF60_07885 [Magnetococcales bacterium]|nr:hypothetical protein [Magnetococcales bacterium]